MGHGTVLEQIRSELSSLAPLISSRFALHSFRDKFLALGKIPFMLHSNFLRQKGFNQPNSYENG